MTVFKLTAALLRWCWGEGAGAHFVWVGFFSYPVDVCLTSLNVGSAGEELF